MSILVFLVDSGQWMGSLLPQWSQAQRTLPATSLPKLTTTRTGHCNLTRYILHVAALILAFASTNFHKPAHDFNARDIAIEPTQLVIGVDIGAVNVFRKQHVVYFNTDAAIAVITIPSVVIMQRIRAISAWFLDEDEQKLASRQTDL